MKRLLYVLALVPALALAQGEVPSGPRGLSRVGSSIVASVPYLAPDGTCAAPAFAWNQDNDGTGSGWYRQAANVWSLCLNGVEIARFTGTELQLLNNADLWVSGMYGPTGVLKWDLSTTENLILNQVANNGVGTRFRNSVVDMIEAGRQLQVINAGEAVWAVSGVGSLLMDTIDSTGSPGNVTQNSPCGRGAIAAGNATVTVTNNTVTASSTVLAILQETDTVCLSIRYVDPAAGSFVLATNGACNADTDFGYCVVKDP